MLLEQCELYVYPRKESDGGELLHHPRVKVINAPLVELSASFIRESIRNKKDVRYMLPESVWDYVEEMHFYERGRRTTDSSPYSPVLPQESSVSPKNSPC